MSISQDGPVTAGTKRKLVEGVHASPMPEAAVNAVFVQAAYFADRLVDLYSEKVAREEVGAGGSGAASGKPASAGAPPSSLLYGRVQSGKTVSMILTAALCLDNGFRIVVVLTSDNVALVRQTAKRFKDLAETRVFAGVKEGAQYEWEGQEDRIKRSIPGGGLVLVCAKNSVNLPEVIKFLKAMGASAYPVLVLDDEADAATPDTTLAARATGKAKAPRMASRIYRLVVANEDPNELAFSLGEELPHSLYVQVTATPYVLYLQRDEAPIRPTETFLLEPGSGYCGGEAFFGAFDPAPGAELPGTLVLVAASEAATIRQAPPPGLLASVDFFLLTACARAKVCGWPEAGFNHLSHTSAKTDEHKLVAGYIRTRLNDLGDLLENLNAAELHFSAAYIELRRTIPSAPPLRELLETFREVLPDVEVFRVNSKVGSPEYGPRLNFVVGGNILGRGLTIPNLLVTYYVREARVSQMDTVWQHARMFGYRASYLEHIRVFLPPQLATRFKEIHDGEEALRRSIEQGDVADTKLIRLPIASRATRPNALDPQAIRGIRAGRDQVNPQQFVVNPKSAAEVGRRLTKLGVVTDSSVSRDRRATMVDASAVVDLIGMVPVAADDAGIWDQDMARAMVRSYIESDGDQLPIYVRGLDAGAGARTRGRLSGEEIKMLQATTPGKPALALLHVGSVSAPEAWFPTLVMPEDSPAFVFEGG